jgi:hypothetical protein
MADSEKINKPWLWHRWDKNGVEPQVRGLVCSIGHTSTTDTVEMHTLHVLLILYAGASMVLIVLFARLRDRFPIKGRAP